MKSTFNQLFEAVGKEDEVLQNDKLLKNVYKQLVLSFGTEKVWWTDIAMVVDKALSKHLPSMRDFSIFVILRVLVDKGWLEYIGNTPDDDPHAEMRVKIDPNVIDLQDPEILSAIL